DTALILFAFSQGQSSRKQEFLEHLKKTYEMNPAEEKTVDCLTNNEYALNPLQTYLLRNTSYVALRLGCIENALNVGQLPLTHSLLTVFSQMMDHPLFKGYLKLSSPEKNTRQAAN